MVAASLRFGLSAPLCLWRGGRAKPERPSDPVRQVTKPLGLGALITCDFTASSGVTQRHRFSAQNGGGPGWSLPWALLNRILVATSQALSRDDKIGANSLTAPPDLQRRLPFNSCCPIDSIWSMRSDPVHPQGSERQPCSLFHRRRESDLPRETQQGSGRAGDYI